jgi:hypothetical protein
VPAASLIIANKEERVKRYGVFMVIIIALLWGASAFGTVDEAKNPFIGVKVAERPNTQYKFHDVGNIWLTVTNFGFFGNSGNWKIYGRNFPSCEFPGGSHEDYLFQGALWIGAIIQTSDTTADTLCSVGADGWQWENEFWPTTADTDTIYEKSSREPESDAVSEEDFMMAYTDDFVVNASPASHRPMGLRIEQTDYAWSYTYNQDFVFLRFDMMNIGNNDLDQLYFGLYIDGDVGPWGPDYDWTDKAQDDITGFRRWRDNADTLWDAGYYDSDGNSIENTSKIDDPNELINLAWLADFDGDKEPDPGLASHPLHREWPVSADGATGTRILYPPPDSVSFNWWISNSDDTKDWGPAVPSDPNDVEGTPSGDVNKYKILSNGYFDPDQVGERGVNADPNFAYPSGVDSINDTRYLLSFGPYEIQQGETLTLIISYIAGEDFVIQYGLYNFNDIALNASWAYRIYDNPGYDTPLPGDTLGDGYKGEYVLYDTTGAPFDDADTVWLTGDGLPDFVGPPPPPIPNMQVIPGDQQVMLLWDDAAEHYKNIFVATLKGVPPGLDTSYFEGYRIYRSETGVPGEWTLLKEFDRIDYTDSTESTPIAWNRGMPTDTVINGEHWYKYVDRNILNYTPHFYAVSAFDKGWPFNTGTILPVLESAVLGNKSLAYPSPLSDGTKDVVVIPNPYRISQTQKYIDLKWEDWEGTGWNEHKRRLTFANLPQRCTIRIYSLAGDLVSTIEHDYTISNRSYEDWNLITKDVQGIVSGIYLFSVEELPGGKIQVGKFVVIK